MTTYHVIATGTGTGSGTEASPWVGFANIPNGVIGGGDIVYLRGTFTPTSAQGLPGLAASATSTNRVNFRGDYPGEPGKFQFGTGGYLNVNRSFLNISYIEIVGANLQAVYIGTNRNYIAFDNVIFRGTTLSASAVILIESASGGSITDITIGNGCLITGTSYYAIRWLVFSTTTTPTPLTNLLLDGMLIQDFVSNRAGLELRVDPGAPAGAKVTNLIIRNSKALNIAGVGWEVSMFREGDLDGFLLEDSEVGYITSVLPPGDTQKLGGGLGISGGTAHAGVQPTIRRTKFHDIVGVGGGIDTFHGGDYLIEDVEIWNIRSDDGDIDGSAIIADTGTTGMTIRRTSAWNIYGDLTSPPGSYKGGAGLNILQGANVKVESYYVRNARMALCYGNPLAPQLNPIESVTVAGSVATITSKYDLGTDMTSPNVRFIWSFADATPEPSFAGTYTFGVNATITGAKTFTVQLSSTPSGPPATFGKFTPYAAQSSVITGFTALECTETCIFVGGLNDKMENNILDGQGKNFFSVAKPTLPLMVQFYPVVNAWTKEKNNLFGGSSVEDPYGRYKFTTPTALKVARRKR